MSMPPNVVERAYQLARSGELATISAIKARLKSERYIHVDRHLAGASIIRDLRRLCAKARPATDA
jgi:hypothetical protein